MNAPVLILTLGALICAAQADIRKIFEECKKSSNLERGDMKEMHACENASDLNDNHVKFLHCMMMKQEMMDKDCRLTVDRQIISDRVDKKCDEMAESTGAVAETENEEQKGEEGEEGGDKKNKKKKGCWWKKLCEPERRENFKKNMTECVEKAKEAYNSAEGTSDQCRNTVFTMKDCMKKKIARKM
ncbi:Protein of unknown function, partial [Gryllus bimaculatus]